MPQFMFQVVISCVRGPPLLHKFPGLSGFLRICFFTEEQIWAKRKNSEKQLQFLVQFFSPITRLAVRLHVHFPQGMQLVCVYVCERERQTDRLRCHFIHWILHAGSGWPCPPPGDLPDPGIEPVSLQSPALAGGFFTTSAPFPSFSQHKAGPNVSHPK